MQKKAYRKTFLCLQKTGPLKKSLKKNSYHYRIIKSFLRLDVDRLRLRDRFFRSAGDRSDFFRPAERDRLREADRSSFFLSLLTDRLPFFKTEPANSDLADLCW